VDLEQLQQHNENTKDQILQTQSVLDVLRNKLAEESRKLDAKKNEYDLLKSMIDSMEGYPDSVKFLHNNPLWTDNSPILSDILYVKEEYRTALENVLEPYLNYYIANNLQAGLYAVGLLEENKKGKANFFLLDKLAANDSNINSEHQLEGAIPALSVVEVDEKYRKLAEHLLGNVFIADNEEVLAEQQWFCSNRKEWPLCKRKYSLTGGSVGLFEGNKIGRVKNLEKLNEEIRKQEAVVEVLRADIQARHNEVIAFNEDLRESAIRETDVEISQLTNQVFALHNKLENLHSMQNNSQHRLEELNLQMQQTNSSVEGVRKSLTDYLQQLEVVGVRLSDADATFKAAEADYNTANTAYNEFNLSVTRQQSKISSLKQELEFKNNQLNDLNQQIEINTGR
jgi:chromosome segregation protein